MVKSFWVWHRKTQSIQRYHLKIPKHTSKLQKSSYHSQRCLHFPQILPPGSSGLLYSLLQVTQGNEVSGLTVQNAFSLLPNLTFLFGFVL